MDRRVRKTRAQLRAGLARLMQQKNIKEITVIRMQVPCCGGIEYAVKKALKDSGKDISCEFVTISTAGKIL